MDYNELAHWGVKGQKWGVRRYQNKDGSLTPAGKKRVQKLDSERRALTGRITPFAKKIPTSDSQVKKKETRNPKKMSSDELKEKIARKRLEKEYREASRDSNSRGRKFVTDVLEDIGKKSLSNIGTQAVNAGLAYAGNKAIEKIFKSNKSFTPEDVEKYVNEFKLYTNNKKKDK